MNLMSGFPYSIDKAIQGRVFFILHELSCIIGETKRQRILILCYVHMRARFPFLVPRGIMPQGYSFPFRPIDINRFPFSSCAGIRHGGSRGILKVMLMCVTQMK